MGGELGLGLGVFRDFRLRLNNKAVIQYIILNFGCKCSLSSHFDWSGFVFESHYGESQWSILTLPSIFYRVEFYQCIVHIQYKRVLCKAMPKYKSDVQVAQLMSICFSVHHWSSVVSPASQVSPHHLFISILGEAGPGKWGGQEGGSIKWGIKTPVFLEISSLQLENNIFWAVVFIFTNAVHNI